MTPRERILATLAHRAPDRTPTDIWFRPEVRAKLMAHLGTRDWDAVLRRLGVEGWALLTPSIAFPEYEARTTPPPEGIAGPRAVWHDGRTCTDAWGVTFRYREDGTYREWIGGPLVDAASLQDVARYPFPSPDRVREPEDYARQVRRLQTEGHFVSGGFGNPFKQAWQLRGLENTLVDYVGEPAMLEAIYDRLYPLCMEQALRMARAGVDMIRIIGDIAMQDRMLLPPDAWRVIDRPRLAHLIEACRAVKPDIHFFFHSDGDLTEVMDDLVDIGFDVINPIQPECMDPVEVKRRWGDRVTLYGCMSVQTTLPFGTPESVRDTARQLVRDCGRNGGLVLAPTNAVQPDVPVENLLAFYDAAREKDA